MSPQKTPRRATSRRGGPARKAIPNFSGVADVSDNPIEQGLSLWSRYARETGETVTDFLRRFGEEQQKSYESWAASVSAAVRPKAPATEAEAARARIQAWNRQAEEIGARVREAFETSLKPQQELLELWAKPFLPPGATAAERTQEVSGIIQKLWSGLTIDLTRKLMEAMQPEKGFDEFVHAQDEVAKQLTENFQKLVRVYFTSPAFVATFGKVLDSSLDLQKTWKDSDELFRRVTGLPTRQEIGELNQAVRDLSDQVSRLNEKRP